MLVGSEPLMPGGPTREGVLDCDSMLSIPSVLSKSESSSVFWECKIQLFLTFMHHEVPIFVLGLFCYDLPSNVLVDSQLSMHLEGQENTAINRTMMLSFLTIDFLDIRTHHTGDIHEML